MAVQPYFPKREGDQLLWLQNLYVKIATYYTALDISPARQTKLLLTLPWLIWTWQTYAPTRRAEATAATSWRNNLATGDPTVSGAAALPPAPSELGPPTDDDPYFGMLTWLFEEIGRWKKAEGYTTTIGEALQIVGPVTPAPPADSKPALKARLGTGGLPEILWKKGPFEGLRIQIDRSDEKGYVNLATDMKPNFTDDLSPLPAPGKTALWTYRAIYLLDDADFGQWSDAVSIAVTG